ncbi:3D-(3,5/4)-trihydroxycyclohexane-1,2-dione acylhydrolase (decyclizing) [Streptomyces sp. AJS327]|uniref:3D-(3,5/4)-trihydroxycyclohexane-1,2-dione acylhydrolase (decyclizing) n=1 Tax=Streptomyces sp. AJS327 TaxID=2545265 RepID=UPI0015DDE01C|nr:3D-(3,5/4)-trihydroxycyclohexane-1,2-dione acylhydrolase (decyclizing) [Streptomyces sp. AJS327]MBA0049701.1 3D-(3,5/4)-trihydroxycyclohexane-1,2-dione acylhydrolase (decyclizing) [Streptomyces sp. AJS327]
MTTERLTVAQALVRFLTAQYTERDGERQRLVEGCWGIFGHGNVAGLGQALVESGAAERGERAPLPFHQGRNEQAMVHAAVGYARHRRRLSAQAVTTSIGPGATNLATGAALATINHLPVLLLPGDTFATRPADPVLQQLEVAYAGDVSVNDVLRPVSRHFDRVSRPEALIPAALEAARVLADPAETGAVTLALPQDVQTEAADWPAGFLAERVWPVRRPPPDPAALDEAVRRVREARRPLLVVGGGVRYSAAEAALRALVEETGIPVAATQSGKGALRHDHPCDLGGVGHTGTAAAAELARHADLVIGVGTRYTDFTTASGTLFTAPGTRFVNLNITAFDAHKMAGVSLVADARAGLDALRAALSGHRVPEAYAAEYRSAKERWERVVAAAYSGDSGDSGGSGDSGDLGDPGGSGRVGRAGSADRAPTQHQVLGALDATLGEEDVLVNAAGSMPGDLHKLWRARSPLQYHVEYGYSCMGYEIPAALGVRQADPDRQVWALVGDGTYLMLPGEIVTAVQERLPIRLVLVQNHGYASIGGLSAATGVEGFGTAYRFRSPGGGYTGEPLPVDLGANAASLGMSLLRARTLGELRSALAEAREADGPVCVHVETAPPPAVSGTEAAAWWDVPVAAVSDRPAARAARAEYERRVAERRRPL